MQKSSKVRKLPVAVRIGTNKFCFWFYIIIRTVNFNLEQHYLSPSTEFSIYMNSRVHNFI